MTLTRYRFDLCDAQYEDPEGDFCDASEALAKIAELEADRATLLGLLRHAKAVDDDQDRHYRGTWVPHFRSQVLAVLDRLKDLP